MLESGTSGEQDREEILELTRLAFDDEFARQREREWHWQWHEDPRLSQPGYRGVVVRAEGRMVGMTTLLPAGLYVAGEPAEAWWQVCTAVHPGFRRQGIGARLQEAMASLTVLGKGVTTASLAMLKKCGYRVVDTGGFWTRTLDLAPRLRRIAGDVGGSALGSLASPLLGKLPPVPQEVVAYEGDFDECFDALWKRARNEYPAIAVRDAETLTWRYRKRPDAKYSVMTYADRGYIVFAEFERRGIARGRIVDLLALPNDEDARQGLLAGALAALHDRGADRLECFATSPVVLDSLRAAGFAPAKRNDPLAVRGTELDDLYLLAGDGDGA